MFIKGTKQKGTWWNEHSEVCVHSPYSLFLPSSMLSIWGLNSETTGPIEVPFLIEFKYRKISQKSPDSSFWETGRPATREHCLLACLHQGTCYGSGPHNWRRWQSGQKPNSWIPLISESLWTCPEMPTLAFSLVEVEGWGVEPRRTFLGSNIMLACSHLKWWHVAKSVQRYFWT